MSPERVKVLDVVELTAASGRWPQGTQRTVLELFGSEAALVEISDDRGHTLDELELPIAVLRTVFSDRAEYGWSASRCPDGARRTRDTRGSRFARYLDPRRLASRELDLLLGRHDRLP
jgi:hypothetical protein